MAGLYVHVPFCKTKCPYCDFYSLVGGGVDRWLAAIETEMERSAGLFDPFGTLYVGGGTPSALPAAALRRLFRSLHATLDLAGVTEVTVEVNPDDVTEDLLDLLRDLGVGRLSVGAQSFDDDALRFLERRHDADGARSALELARSAGFDELSLDLIYGLEGQTPDQLEGDLGAALAFSPEHLSCYLLTIAEDTPFGRRAAAGALQTAGEAASRELFLGASRFLAEAGYEHYEVSSFARGREHRSRHNQGYWSREGYLGLGPAAHSFRGDRRWWNVRSLEDYCSRIEAGVSAVDADETLTAEQVRLEELMLGLRRSDGVPESLLSGYPAWEEVAEGLVAEGLVTRRAGRIAPTREGLLLSDGLPLRFMP